MKIGYKCPICNKYNRLAFCNKCLHVFCEKCWKGDAKCPNCNNQLSGSSNWLEDKCPKCREKKKIIICPKCHKGCCESCRAKGAKCPDCGAQLSGSDWLHT